MAHFVKLSAWLLSRSVVEDVGAEFLDNTQERCLLLRVRQPLTTSGYVNSSETCRDRKTADFVLHKICWFSIVVLRSHIATSGAQRGTVDQSNPTGSVTTVPEGK